MPESDYYNDEEVKCPDCDAGESHIRRLADYEREEWECQKCRNTWGGF